MIFDFSFTDLLPTGVTPDDVIVSASSLIAFFTVLAVWYGLLVKAPLCLRASQVIKRQEVLREGLVASKRRTERQTSALGLASRVIEKLNLLRSQEAEKVKKKLSQAGYRSKDALVLYLVTKIIFPFGFGGAMAFVVYGLELIPVQPLMKVSLSMMAVLIGAFAPEIWLNNAITKRKAALQKGLPDALDLLVICAEAGLSVDAALKRVSREMMQASPGIGGEFALTAVELSFLPNRREALENLIDRTDMPSIRGVANTLIQTEKYGTPLAHSLRVLTREFRTERMLKAEEKAAKLPATLTVPMIAFILPSLFIVLLGPAFVRALPNLQAL